MFRNFHLHLEKMEVQRTCNCNACANAVHLTLKVITHYGEFTGYTVKNFNKLIGKDVIIAHQLLKNDIAKHEYWIATPDVLKNNVQPEVSSWIKWDSSYKKTEEGNIRFYYTLLHLLKDGKMLDEQ